MVIKLANIALIVRDQDEALKFYTEVLGFEKRTDYLSGGSGGTRWVTVAPKGQQGVEIVLFKPGQYENPQLTYDLMAQCGRQSHWVFETDDCRRDYLDWMGKGVKFRGTPEDVPWGVQVVFEDLYGNQFVLLEPYGPT